MLQEILIEAGYSPFSYSGRDMYGTSCLAVRAGNIGVLFSDIINSLGNSANYGKLANAFRTMRTDSMGLDMVVYFPTVAYIETNKCKHEYLPDEDGTVYTCGADCLSSDYDLCTNHRF